MVQAQECISPLQQSAHLRSLAAALPAPVRRPPAARPAAAPLRAAVTLAFARGVTPVVAGRAVPRPLAVRLLQSRHPRPLLREALW
jgi:hypothetical protein